MLTQGRLIWMAVRGYDGQWKSRPVVVITANRDIPSSPVIVGVACSHSAAESSDPLPENYVDLPFHPSGNCRTKLTKRTVAICNWVVRIEKATIQLSSFGGLVPPQQLETIIVKFIELTRKP